MRKRKASNEILNAMGRNVQFRNFLELIDEQTECEEILEQINRLMGALIDDQQNLINMLEKADSYVVQSVVLDVWESQGDDDG